MNKYEFPSTSLLNKSNQILKKYIKDSKDNKLSILIGLDDNKSTEIDLKEIPHLLIFGPTGSGKSVFLDTLIITLLYKNSPKDINLVLMDPKKVELGTYNKLPHLMYPVISDTKEGVKKLNRLSNLINLRKEVFIKNKVKDINNYNKLEGVKKLASIIIVIDESCDIMSISKASDSVLNIIKYGAKTGIHIIMATNSHYEQNLPKTIINKVQYKISFDQISEDDAKIVGLKDANLLRIGEVIASSSKENELIKLNTPYISDDDIKNVVDFIKDNN